MVFYPILCSNAFVNACYVCIWFTWVLNFTPPSNRCCQELLETKMCNLFWSFLSFWWSEGWILLVTLVECVTPWLMLFIVGFITIPQITSSLSFKNTIQNKNLFFDEHHPLNFSLAILGNNPIPGLTYGVELGLEQLIWLKVMFITAFTPSKSRHRVHFVILMMTKD